MTIMDCEESELLEKNILTQEEIDKYSNLRIPYPAPSDVDVSSLYRFRDDVQYKVEKAINEKLIEPRKSCAFYERTFQVISDRLGEGVQGVLNHADGKIYDSKSSYYKAVKAAGCEIVGNDAPTEPRKEIRGNFDVSKELKAALQQHLR